MARETKTVKIKENTYHIKHLAASAQRKVLMRIMSAAATLVAYGEEVDIVELIREVVNTITSEDLDLITNCFAEETQLITPESGGTAVKLSDCIEEMFSGPGMADWLQWIRVCIDHNYAGFFIEMRAQIQEKADANKKEDKKQA